MLSGGSGGFNTNSMPPPSKPWEVLPTGNVFGSNPLTEAYSPPPPPPPLPQTSYHEQSNINNPGWIGSGNYYSGGAGGYGRYSYPSNYNSGYNSYSSPYHMNNGPFSGGPPAPGNYITSSLENTTRPLFDSLNHVLQAINHVACFVDSTVFAVWTSVTAAGSIIAAVKSIKNVYIRKWVETVRNFIKNTQSILKTSSGRRKLIILASIAATIPVLMKALYFILKVDESQETSLIPMNPEDNDLSSTALFVRAIYSHDPTDKNVYLTLNPGDVILISKDDESKINASNPTWIAGKLKNGSAGYFPSNYVTVIK